MRNEYTWHMGLKGGIKMIQENLSRRGFLRFLGIFFVGLFAIRWQKVRRIFSQKKSPKNLKEAKYYSRGDEIAG